jgi:hypothetical protein
MGRKPRGGDESEAPSGGSRRKPEEAVGRKPEGSGEEEAPRGLNCGKPQGKRG